IPDAVVDIQRSGARRLVAVECEPAGPATPHGRLGDDRLHCLRYTVGLSDNARERGAPQGRELGDGERGLWLRYVVGAAAELHPAPARLVSPGSQPEGDVGREGMR